MKEFLKLTKTKIVLLVVFFGITSSIRNLNVLYLLGSCFDCPNVYGFPWFFYSVAGNFGPAGKYGDSHFYLGWLIFDLVFMYLLSCLIILIYNKIKR